MKDIGEDSSKYLGPLTNRRFYQNVPSSAARSSVSLSLTTAGLSGIFYNTLNVEKKEPRVEQFGRAALAGRIITYRIELSG